MIKSNDANIKNMIKTFNELGVDNLAVLDTFYDAKAEFQDPAVKIKGIENLKKYYAAVYKNVKSIQFDFTEIIKNDLNYYATWTMHLSATGLNSGKKFTVEGISVIHFNEKNLVTHHRDYLDLGDMVYERLPILGTLVSLVKKKLAHGM